MTVLPGPLSAVNASVILFLLDTIGIQAEGVIVSELGQMLRLRRDQQEICLLVSTES